MSHRTALSVAAGAIVLLGMIIYGSSRQGPVEEVVLTDPEVTALAEDMLNAFTIGDYARFSAAFTEEQLASMNKASFVEWRAPLIETTGAFIEITTVEQRKAANKKADRYVFHAAFEYDDSVQFAIVFKPGTQSINRVELKPDK